jgi:hypothetical protein
VACSREHQESSGGLAPIGRLSRAEIRARWCRISARRCRRERSERTIGWALFAIAGGDSLGCSFVNGDRRVMINDLERAGTLTPKHDTPNCDLRPGDTVEEVSEHVHGRAVAMHHAPRHAGPVADPGMTAMSGPCQRSVKAARLTGGRARQV